jgi:acetyl esterase
MRVGARAALRSAGLVRIAGRRRRTGRDAGLDPQIAAILEFERIARMPALDSMEPARARAYAEHGLSPLDLDPVAMAEVIDTGVAPGVPVRIFVPPEVTADWIVYFHGGGGVIGSIESSEPMTRYLAERTRCTVASVGYRLGPEHRHPAAIEDACAAYRAVLPRLPAGARIAVAGDSFGGFLAAHVEHLTRRERRPDLQVLIYPIVDLTLTSPSIDRLAEGYLLTRAMMHWFRSYYLHPEDDRRAPSPWFWPDAELRGAAPAIVVTAGFDPLVHEGDAWAERLAAAGAPVRHRCERSLVHGFVSMAGALDAPRAALDRICTDIVDLLRQ